MSIPAAQDAVLVRKYIDAGDIGSRTTIPEVRTLKRIDRLDDLIERNEIAGNKKAAKRNLEERDALVKKIQKRQALRTRNKVLLGETERLAREDAMRDISADRSKKVRGGRVQQYSDKGLQRLSQAVSKTKSSSITSRGIAKIPDRLMLKLFGRRIAKDLEEFLLSVVYLTLLSVLLRVIHFQKVFRATRWFGWSSWTFSWRFNRSISTFIGTSRCFSGGYWC